MREPRILYPQVVLSFVFLSSLLWGQQPVTIAERVKTQEAIERVAYEHRIWPGDNPTPKPPLGQMAPPELLERKALEPLKMGAALRERWGLEITPAMLQGELDRMARETRDPATLRELFAALGNDPYLLAETLARSIVTERALRGRYAYDGALHANGRNRVAALEAKVVTGEDWAGLDAEYTRVRLLRQDPGQPEDDTSAGRGGLPQTLVLSEEEWAQERERLASIALTGFREDETGWRLERLIGKSPRSLEVESLFVPKRSFDAWWAEVRGEFSPLDLPAISQDHTFRLPVPIQPSAGGCDTWEDRFLIDRVPDARIYHSLVWTGTEVIVWGGWGFGGTAYNTGGRYNPATDTWSATSTGAGVPDPHSRHAAVWTGTEMILWGGIVSPSQNNSGGRYNPVADTWAPTSLTGAPFASSAGDLGVWTGTVMVVWGSGTGGRYNPSSDSWQGMSTAGQPSAADGFSAVWTGSEMLVWGGHDWAMTTAYNTGAKYNPTGDTWTATTTTNAPSARAFHTAVWTGTEMIVWGGHGVPSNTRTNTGGRYNPSTNSWVATSLTAAPTARTYHTAAWAASAGVMVVWGGLDTNYANTGSRYSPAGDTWTATTMTNAPAARSFTNSIWTGAEMVVWGGQTNIYLNSGGRYYPGTDTWLPTGNGGAPAPRTYHAGLWTGNEMVVWSGWGGGAVYYQTGGRYFPATATWLPMSLTGAPTARRRPSAVWTGSEIIFWGGDPSFLNTGGRYNPTSDGWTALTTTGSPTGRWGHSAVWTGTEMIVWGGDDNNSGYVNTGGRYTPSPEAWATMATGPTARRRHAAVWTGSQMVVWGGELSTGSPPYTDTGSRYTPGTNSWSATSLAGAPAARYYHTMVWTGAEAIVWGGFSVSPINTGGRYEPVSDTWLGVSTGAGVPSQRQEHTAVWTGSSMVVWGGYGSSYLNSGGRYTPSADSWQSTAVMSPTASGRYQHLAVWTGSQMLVWGGQYGTVYLDTGGIYNLSGPSSPAGTLKGARSTTVDFNWDAATGATSYNVKRCSGIPCTPTTVVATPAANSYSEAMDGTSYFYAVEAVNGCGTTP